MTEKNKLSQKQQQEESEWSLSSLQELKGLNLQDLKDEQDRDEMPKQSQGERKPKIQPKYPPMQNISADCKFYPVGKVIQKVGELVIVEANSSINLVDLDNWLFLHVDSQQKQCVGFVIDIFGRVDHPYYAIKMLDEAEKKSVYWGEIIGLQLFYAEGCKTLTEEDIRSIKQKSSMNKQADQGSDSESQQAEHNDSEHIQQRSNMMIRDQGYHHDRKRKASYQQDFYRDRTREKKNFHRDHDDYTQQRHHNRRNNHRHHNVEHRNQARDRMHNQQYLESMYATYYTQMMQLYNGQNGMPMPKPPVFPPASQPMQSPFMQPHMQSQMPQMQMFPMPSMQMPLFPMAVSPFGNTVQPNSTNNNPNNPQ